ncbi:unnamed protein product, partial [Ixodes pacificus]
RRSVAHAVPWVSKAPAHFCCKTSPTHKALCLPHLVGSSFGVCSAEAERVKVFVGRAGLGFPLPATEIRQVTQSSDAADARRTNRTASTTYQHGIRRISVCVVLSPNQSCTGRD